MPMGCYHPELHNQEHLQYDLGALLLSVGCIHTET